MRKVYDIKQSCSPILLQRNIFHVSGAGLKENTASQIFSCSYQGTKTDKSNKNLTLFLPPDSLFMKEKLTQFPP